MKGHSNMGGKFEFEFEFERALIEVSKLAPHT
jgi:hypothetical protein